MNIYISGPVTGIENENRPEFERVRWTLKGVDGVRAVGIPHDYVMGSTITWEMDMRRSIVAMLDAHEIARVSYTYDAIAMLDGWEDSKGARIEHDLAEALGIPCKPWREYL